MSEQNRTSNETARIEAFSDGVLAIAITLLILEIQVPPQTSHGRLRAALFDLWPSYLAFLASFMTIGVMWLNHHRLFTLINKKDDGLNVGAITRQYALGPILYAVLMGVAFFDAEWCLLLSALFALYFALPPSLWNRSRR